MKKTLLLIFLGIVFSIFVYATTNDAYFSYTLDDAYLDGNTIIDSAETINATNVGATTGVSGVLGEAFSFVDNDYLTVPHNAIQNDHTITISLWFKQDNADTAYLLAKGTSYNTVQIHYSSGSFYFSQSDSGCDSWNTQPSYAHTRDSSWHHLVVKNDGSVAQMWFDGVNVVNDSSPTTSTCVETLDIIIGSTGDHSGNFLDGDLDQIIFYNRPITTGEILELYNSGSGFDPYALDTTPPTASDWNVTSGNVVSGESTITWRDNIQNYINVTNGTLSYTFTADENSNHSAYVDSKTDYLNADENHKAATTETTSHANTVYDNFSFGNHFLFISLIDLVGNVKNYSLNFTLVDTITPSIFNCSVNDTDLTCLDTVRLNCTVTDNGEIDSVKFNYTLREDYYNDTSNISDFFYFDIYFDFYNLGNITETFYFNYAFANDTLNNTNITDVNISFNYTCEVCNSSYNELYDVQDCRINDTLLNVTYYSDDINSCIIPNPEKSSNVTNTEGCNYCDEDINLYNTPTENQSCNDFTLLQNMSYYYVDDNYYTCCNVTNISSDCNILNESLYFNYTQIDDCSSIDCLYDSSPYLKFFDKKIPLICEVNKNTTYDFLVYVKADNQTIQSNPKRQLIDDYGEYNSFKSENGLVNLYYMSTNLRPDRNITVIVEGQNGIFYNEFVVVPTYKDPFQLQDRLFWTWDNAGLLIGGFFMILIFGVFVVFLIRYAIHNW